ncbi:GNAT family protein [Spongiactinospora sp. TRM90649]|uniref:GNAT family N-acetyltransferase n=1 Tax=Spongiactinospora sp. TRM90649 TaxID=3031114 RepID=UPI0023F78E77|nr:GNAT family protein [Spongiactinospora sp. TRM90649]MDF5751097.1 GNAT family protein [Spongiactinospora sp. TRM90649]
MNPVTITSASGRLALREFAPSDAPALLRIYGDPQVVQHMSFEPRTLEQVEATIAAVTAAAEQDPRREFSLAVVRQDDGELVGFARLAIDTQHPGQNSGQIGFALRADQWGRGIGGETVGLLLALGFNTLGLYRIWGARSPENDVSRRVMDKAGMVEEGRIRGHIMVRGAYRDSVVHSILAPEWEQARTAR